MNINLLEDNDVGKTTTAITTSIYFCVKYVLALLCCAVLFCFSFYVNGIVSNYSKCLVFEHLVTAYCTHTRTQFEGHILQLFV